MLKSDLGHYNHPGPLPLKMGVRRDGAVKKPLNLPTGQVVRKHSLLKTASANFANHLKHIILALTMPQLNNHTYLKGFRRELRNNLTPAEVALWKLLKSKQLEGLKFRRQHSFGPYIMDFYCPSQKLCIELDGQGHFTAEGMERDEKRTAHLNSFGIRVLRFENKDVLHFQENVLESIKNSISR